MDLCKATWHDVAITIFNPKFSIMPIELFNKRHVDIIKIPLAAGGVCVEESSEVFNK